MYMKSSVNKLLAIQEAFMTDPDYQCLYREYQQLQADYRSALEQLKPECQQIISAYLGICIEMHTRMLLLACQ